MATRNLRAFIPGVRARRAVPTRPWQAAQWVARPRESAIQRYELSRTFTASGNPHMGDLFNDIVGAVVPGWAKRPDWMKNIQIKPDPAKLVQAAAKVVPPKEVGRVVDQAAKYGVNLQYHTPAGNVPVTGQMISGGYQNFPAFAQLSATMASVPTWVYMAGGMGIVLLVLMSVKK